MLRGREPLIQFSSPDEASTENLALQFRKLELLIGNRVASAERGFGESDLIVLPGEIAQGEQAVAGELVQCPVATPLEFEHAGFHTAAAGNGCDFRQVELGIVLSLEMGMAEVCNLPAGGEVGVAGVPFERRNHGRVGSQ